MANIPGLPVGARLIATALARLHPLVEKIKKTNAWLSQVIRSIRQHQTLTGTLDRVQLTLRLLRPNWQGSRAMVALLLVVLVTNIVVVRAEEDSREFLDVEPDMAAQILEEISPFTPFDEDLEQAKLVTSGEADGFFDKPDFKETRKAGTSYTIQPGDTLDSIAKKYSVNVATLLEVNDIAVKEITAIKAGQVLQIPPYNTSDSTAWLEEAQKIAQAKVEARAREQAKRKLALAARDGFSRNDDRGQADVHFDGDSEDCSSNPVTQSLGISRGIKGRHQGIDIRGHQGTPITAGRSGIVSSIKWERGFGKTVRVKEESNREAIYAHTSGYADIAPGETVEQGEVIAFVGSTGWSTGPHLHYEVRQSGRVVNPFRC